MKLSSLFVAIAAAAFAAGAIAAYYEIDTPELLIVAYAALGVANAAFALLP